MLLLSWHVEVIITITIEERRYVDNGIAPLLKQHIRMTE
jgi:hypothetical protein